MIWSQTYDPLGNLALSAFIASVPVVVLLLLLACCHVRAHLAAAVGLALAIGVAIFVYGMPARLALSAALFGACYGLLPIGWIVICAIFIYEITVDTGQFEALRSRIAHLTDDRRVQVLLIAFSFGAFIEGAAGFGTPVAISAAMLIGLGFRPLPAAGLALIGNTAPVAYGALGSPVIALAGVTELPLMQLSQMIGRQLPVFSLLVPFWLVWSMVGWRQMLRVWPACLTAGGSFGAVQFAVSNWHGPWLVDIAGSVTSIVALVLLLRFWQPPKLPDQFLSRITITSALEPETSSATTTVPATRSIDQNSSIPSPSGPTWKALLPWFILVTMVSLWGIPQVNQWLQRTTLSFPVAGLHQQIQRMPPVAPTTAGPEKAVFEFKWLSATGTALLITGWLAGMCLGLRPRRIAAIFSKTVQRTSISLLTISAMLALGFTTRYSGLDATMGLAMANTGWLFPFFSPLLGWLGVALTGSDTASNVLFGNLQQITAQQLGFSPVLTAAANSSGGVMGKMIDAQSIVVAGVATGQQDQEGTILRYVFFHSLALAILVGLLVAIQAYVIPWIVP